MKTIKIEIPIYSPKKGIEYKWEKGFDIETQFKDEVIKLIANKAGLISLANHLLNLAQDIYRPVIIYILMNTTR